MSSVICYIELAARGGTLRSVRVVGLHGEDAWRAPSIHTDADPVRFAQDTAAEAAQWIAEAAAEITGSRSARLDRVCVHADGAVCAPVPKGDLGSADLIRDLSGGADDFGDGVDDAGYSSPPRFPDLPGELTAQPLELDDHAASASPAKRAPRDLGRVGLLAIPDAPARLLLDQLDRIGMSFGPVVSAWHAIAAVWDPGGGPARRSAGAHGTGRPEASVVASSTPASAAVLVDPASARLIWSWSHRGALVASGSTRLGAAASGDAPEAAPKGAPKGAPEGARLGVVPASAAGRLIAEWMSWSAQLGVVPERVVCVGPFGPALGPAPSPPAGVLPAGPDADSAGRNGTRPGVPAALDGPGFGEAISSRWPGATVDLVEAEDPVGLTLARYVERVDARRDPRAAGEPRAASEIVRLSDRPGRAHRWMYRSLASAVLVFAVVLVLGGLGLRAAADAMRTGAAAFASREAALIEQIDPDLDARRFSRAVEQIRAQIRELQSLADPRSPFEPPRPILAELDALVFVIGSDVYELERVRLGPASVSVELFVDELEQYEQLTEAIRGVAGRATELTDRSVVDSGGRLRATYIFRWNETPTGSPS